MTISFKLPIAYNDKQTHQFYVGLVEGDGTITVDEIRGRPRVRVRVDLKNDKDGLNANKLK